VPSSSSTARSAPRRATNTYAPPTPLEDLHILDYLELAGSQYKAARALEMHQTTVCRSLQLMQRQFALINTPGSAICRHGHNLCMQHLRLAYREHRLMAEQPPLSEQLWLLLPQRAEGSRAARLCLRRLRLQVTKLKTMQDRHGIQV
jgi:predicted DNA-binding protein (UPF0251 family)